MDSESRNRALMSEELCTMLCDNETRELGSTDSPRAYTRDELRSMLERHYDATYDKDVRDAAPVPTQLEVDQCLAMMLGESDPIIETTADGKIFMVQNDIEVMRCEKIIMGELHGD